MSNYDLSAWPLFRSVIGDNREDAAKNRRCFFISPLDDASPDVRRHAETLWRYVVRPALLDTDYAPRRFEPEPGARLPQAAVDAILDDDLIVAVVSANNPQVFYQVAIAQAAARPLVLMIEEGRDLPIDPRGAPVITYSLDTDAILSAVNVRKLSAAARALQQSEASPQQTFRPGTPALAGGGAAGATVFERSAQFTWDQRLQVIRDADTRVDIMGLANLALAAHPDMVELLRQRSGQGLELRVLQCAPTNPALSSLLSQRDKASLNTMRDEIEAAADVWKRIAEMADLDLAITLRRSQNALPVASLLITDRQVIATPYLVSRDTASSPTLQAVAGSAHYRAMQEEFDLLWSEASTVFRAEPRAVARHAAPANGNARPDEAPRPAAQPQYDYASGNGVDWGYSPFRTTGQGNQGR